MSRGFVLGVLLTVVLVALAILLLVGEKETIVDDNAHNILGIVESSLMKEYRDPAMQDSLHHDFLAIHEKVRQGDADSAGLRRLVREFYRYYGDGRIDSLEANALVKNVVFLANE